MSTASAQSQAMHLAETHRHGRASLDCSEDIVAPDRSPGHWLSLTRALLAISMAALLLAGCTKPHKHIAIAHASPPSRLLQVGLVLDSPAPDAIQVPAPHKQGRTNELLSVRLVPGLDDGNLGKNHQIGAFGLHIGVEVQFRGTAVRQLADLTRTNIGKHMVVLSDGKVVSAPKIIRELPDGLLFLPGDWTFDQAMDFCKRLNPSASSK